MATDLERSRPAIESRAYAQWVSETTGLSQEEKRLKEAGYRLFFDRVLALPINQESKHLSNYQESDLNLVEFTHDDVHASDTEETEILRQIQDITGFWPPYSIGVFGVDDDNSESHKGDYSQSANLVIRSAYGNVFKDQMVIHVWQEFNISSGEHRGHIDNINYGNIRGEIGELRLLQVANALADVYSKKIK